MTTQSINLNRHKGISSSEWTKPPILDQLSLDVKGLGLNDSNPIVLVDLKINAEISGLICKTELEMTFENPSSRVLEGELVFPMPEDAVVAGYALDVEGILVEASLVEKEKATKVFEAEIKKGVDPGLVEHVKGNNFKTRIYPLPPNGTRTVRVNYISHLTVNSDNQVIYYIPLMLAVPVAKAQIDVRVISRDPPAFINSELANLEFESTELSEGLCLFSSNYQSDDFSLADSSLLVDVPFDVESKTIVEAKDDEYYFIINDLSIPEIETIKSSKISLNNIAVLWDASLSRFKQDLEKEYLFLNQLMQSFETEVNLDIFVFRHEVDEKVTFSSANSDDLIDFLKNLAYDGGTRLDIIDIDEPSQYNYILFCTDGMGTIGPDSSPLTARRDVPPIYTITSSNDYNPQLLKYNAFSTGGQFFHLLNYTDLSSVISKIGVPSFSFVNLVADSGEIEEVYPSMTVPLSANSFNITGKLKSTSATLKVNYGFGLHHILHTFTCTIDSAKATQTGLVPLMWAQKKIDELSVFEEENKNQIIDLGRKFHIVTPGTSLIVLENLSQHIEHKIEPHPSRSSLYQQYQDHLQGIERTEAEKIQTKLNQVYSWWSERISWWNKKFVIPEPKVQSISVQSEGFGGAPPPPMAMSSPPPPPMAMSQVSGAPPPPMSDIFMAAAPARRMRSMAPERSRSVMMEMDECMDDMDDFEELETASAAPSAPSPARDVGASVAVKFWDPQTPYLAVIKGNVGDVDAKYLTYLEQRAEYIDTPAFYIDCAHFFIHNDGTKYALRILTNIPELKLESHQLLRMLGYKLDEIGALEIASLVFEKVKQLRPDEPQSFRDLGLIYDQLGDYQRAIDLLWDVVTGEWNPSFEQIELTALYEMNNIIAKCNGYPDQGKGKKEIQTYDLLMPHFFDDRFLQNLDVDLRISMAWDTDNTDMDLHVIEPNGEEAYYAHNLTTIGGKVSRDFTRGYGPEEYMLKVAMKGTYIIKTNYFGSSQASLTGPTTLLLCIFTNYGRPDETLHKSLIRLGSSKDNSIIGEITI